jgi:hypothetical protein
VFEDLDFVYTPSNDPAADRDYFVDVLGARFVFAIQHGEHRVAAVELSDKPLILFADHLDGERPILIYRVDDFEATLDWLESNGMPPEERFEIPHGPCCTFDTPTGHKLGVYQLTRPQVNEHFTGRREF